MAAQRRRTHNVILSGAFLLLLLLFFIINLCVKDKEFSDTENRSLAQKPQLSWSSLVDGSYFAGVTSHFSDQFFARDGWISLKLRQDSLLGRKDAGGVYLCEDDYLMAQPEAPDEEALAVTVDAIRQLKETYPDLDMYMLAVPGAASILTDYLPKNAPVRDQLADLDALEQQLSGTLTFLDAATPLANNRTEYIYYKTDHHWTTLGAYRTFCYNAASMGLTSPTVEYETYPVSNSFEGTLSSKSGSHSALDTINIYVPGNFTPEYYVSYPDSTEKVCSIYRSDCLDVKDQYTVFFGGNHSMVEIKTTANNDRNLLLFKDSYANCFVEFLLPYYENIIMIDPRYYYDNVTSIINNQGITDVLFLYSADTILTDTALKDVLNAGAPTEAPEAAFGAAPSVEATPVAEDSAMEEGSLIDESVLPEEEP